MIEAGQVLKEEYYIDIDAISKQSLLYLRLATDMLPIIDKHNKSPQPTFHEFPGRGINGLIANYDDLAKVVGNKELAHKVIEYHDKNGKPVAWLYPTGRICVSSRKYESDMNRATFDDLQREQKLRITWMQNIRNMKTK